MNFQHNSRYHEVHARSLADPEGFWRVASVPFRDEMPVLKRSLIVVLLFARSLWQFHFRPRYSLEWNLVEDV